MLRKSMFAVALVAVLSFSFGATAFAGGHHGATKHRNATGHSYTPVNSAVKQHNGYDHGISGSVKYYDQYGHDIVVRGMYYDNHGCPMFSSECYYIDADGEPVYVGGHRAYYYGADGKLAAGTCYYGADGDAVSCPASYLNGWGYGTSRYDAQGQVVNGAFYYDGSGNLIDPSVAVMSTCQNYCGGCWHK